MSPAFMSKQEVSERLGISTSTLNRRLPDMRRAGFPEIDPVMDRYPTAAVEAWIEKRSGVSDTVERSQTQGVNLNAL